MIDSRDHEERRRADRLHRQMITWLCDKDRPPVQHMQAIDVLNAALDRLLAIEDGLHDLAGSMRAVRQVMADQGVEPPYLARVRNYTNATTGQVDTEALRQADQEADRLNEEFVRRLVIAAVTREVPPDNDHYDKGAGQS
jgi:hypothetical protein